jgi:predicted P-loop ATPase
MTKKLLILDDEFGGKSKQDAKKFKDLISKQTFTLRRPYGRVSEDLPRFAVLCGTSNEDEVINDPTGNSRIIPVNITSFNLERFKSIDKRALWAEVLDFYNEVGNDWMLSKDDINDLGRIAATNKQASQEEEAFLQFFGIPEEGDFCDYKTNTEIKTTIELNTRLKISHVKLAAVLKALGVKKQVKKLNGVAQTVYAVTSLQP